MEHKGGTGSMARGRKQKLKLFYLYKIMCEETDRTHYLTMPQIVERLASYGVEADRKSLYDDMDALNLFGIEVQRTRDGAHTYYNMTNRPFELAEMKFLVDAVQASKFISEKETKEIIRKGRINRYKCLAIRQDIAGRFADRSFNSDVWQELFSMAAEEIRSADQSELVPYWCLGKNQTVKIERIIPMYPVSKDEVNYQRLIKVLSLYRLTMGQARQEELVDYILESGMKERNYIKNLFINLSPYVRTDETWKEKMAERKPVVEVKKKSERQMRIETLQNELQTCEEQLSALKAEKDTLKSYEIIGMIVTHKSFGDGLAVGTDGTHITVEFDVGEKTFLLPQAFEKGFLTSEYPDFLESINKNDEIDGEIEAVSSVIEEKKELLANLII